MDSIGKQIYDVLYSMRLAPRHQLEQAANEIAKLFAAPPAPVVPDADLCPHCNPCRNGERIAKAEQLNEAYDVVLRGLASYVGAGGYNSTGLIIPEVADDKIRWGIDHLTNVAKYIAASSAPAVPAGLAEYIESRRKTIEASIAAEVLSGNTVKEQAEQTALAELDALHKWVRENHKPAPAGQAEVRQFIYSTDLYGLLADIQNGIDSPATVDIANKLIIQLDRVHHLLAATPEREGT